jgi:hypothetical protein
MHVICPECKKSRELGQTIKVDVNTNKKWLITYCMYCKFNFDLEELPHASPTSTDHSVLRLDDR